MRKIEKVWFTDDEVWILTDSGEKASEKFEDYPKLRYASVEERAAYTVDTFGIHWEGLDEDLSFDGFFNKKESPDSLYSLFMAHPELNASAVARRMGISQSLFAQYISGYKKPSDSRLREIISTIREIGKELSSIEIETVEIVRKIG